MALSTSLADPASTYLTTAEAACILGVGASRVRRLVMAGDIDPADIYRVSPRLNLLRASAICRLAVAKGRDLPPRFAAMADDSTPSSG